MPVGESDSVPETDAPLFVSVTTPDPTLAGSTGSEKFTVTGVVNGTFRAPFAGLTATTVGGVGATPSARAATITALVSLLLRIAELLSVECSHDRRGA